MNKCRWLALLLLSLALPVVLAACSHPEAPTRPSTLRVMLAVSEGCTVTTPAVVEVEPGGTAAFHVEFAGNYAFLAADAGVFDAESGTLTLENVTRPTFVTLTAENVGYDTNTVVTYFFQSKSSADKSSVKDNSAVRLGTEITVVAGDTSRLFTGWSVGRSDEIVSQERSYTFRVTPDALTPVGGMDCFLMTPHYASLNVYYYDANGGRINKTTVNAKGNANAAVDASAAASGRLKVTLSTKYLEYCTCATAFWNDGTFTRDGYILREFNTKPDGSGESYSPGAKFYQVNPDGGDFVLYCIWEKTDESAFTAMDYSMSLPKGYSDRVVPEFHKNGVIITGYTGDAETVAIPETIGGKPVIALARGAIRNKSVKTLLFPRMLQEVKDGAVQGCASLDTLYFPGGMWSIGNAAFDDATYSNFHHLIVYANIAPRYATSEVGAYGVKLSRILSSGDRNRVIAIAGSSTLQGLGTAYLEDLLDNTHTVVNFGTTRTTHGSLYLEAMQHYTHEGDVLLFAPENSVYMMGSNELYWKTIRDMEMLFEFFRYVDIAGYTNVFGAFTVQNQTNTYKRSQQNYEAVLQAAGSVNKYGDDIKANKNGYVDTSATKYNDCYNLSFNNRFKSTNEGDWAKSGYQNNYSDDRYWISIDEPPCLGNIRRVVAAAKSGGAAVYFGFCPADASSVFEEARSAAWFDAYDAMMRDRFGFDGIVGSSKTYLLAHQYFFDCAFHTNNYGRTWRTYYLYRDLCALFGREVKYQNGDLGTDYQSCLFEKDESGRVLTSPKYTVGYWD